LFGEPKLFGEFWLFGEPKLFGEFWLFGEPKLFGEFWSFGPPGLFCAPGLFGELGSVGGCDVPGIWEPLGDVCPFVGCEPAMGCELGALPFVAPVMPCPAGPLGAVAVIGGALAPGLAVVAFVPAPWLVAGPPLEVGADGEFVLEPPPPCVLEGVGGDGWSMGVAAPEHAATACIAATAEMT
jgi:hypothetical protein